MQLAFSTADSEIISTLSSTGGVRAGGDQATSVADEKLASSDEFVRMDWFRQGIADENCALFEAALYPIRPVLAEYVKEHLASRASTSLSAEHLAVNLVVDDLVFHAFERSESWSDGEPVVAWLVRMLGELTEDMADE